MALNWFKNYGDLHDGVTGDTIRAAAEDPNENANIIAALASELAEDEQHVAGDIEGDIEAGTRTNPAQVQLAASELAQAGYYAVALLKEFATSVDVFDDGVEELNDQLRHDTASAQRYAGQGAAESEEEPPTYEESFNNIREYLEPRYRDLDTALEDSAESVASRFESGPTPENVKELILAGLIPFSVAAAQWPGIQLSPQEKFEAYQAAVENGTLPSVEEMTETERQAFLQENPDLLEEWMQVEAPPAELQEVIIGLALPDVDAEDADVDVQTILDGIDGDATAAEIRDAFGNSGEVASGLALLLPWANRTGVDLGTHGRATDAQQYSEAFGRQTWEHREDIETLLTDGVEREYTTGAGTPRGEHTATRMESIFSEEEAEELRSQWAGSYLVASNEDIGGGWDALPDDMKYDLSLQQDLLDTGNEPRFVDVATFLDGAQGDLPAGDGLTLELANSAAELLDTRYNTGASAGPGPGSEPGWINTGNEELYGSLLERAALNPEATTVLLGGDPGYEIDHLPEDFSSDEFVTNVYTHPWDDGGEAASSLTNWTIDPPAGQEDLADAAYNGLYDTIAGNQEVFDALISLEDNSGPGTRDLEDGDIYTVGERNPELMRSLALATGPRLDQFDTATTAEEERQRIRMFMLINTDQAQTEDGNPDPNNAAVKLATSIEAYQQQRVYDALNPDHQYSDDGDYSAETVGEQNGTLAGLNTSALRNVVYEMYESENERAEQIAKTQQTAISLVGGAIPWGDAGPLGSVLTKLAEESITPADVALPPDFDPDLHTVDIDAGNTEGVELVARAQYLNGMIAQDPSLAAEYEHLGIIDENGNVNISGVQMSGSTRLNEDLAGLMPDNVNTEVDDVVRRRSELASTYGLTHPDHFGG